MANSIKVAKNADVPIGSMKMFVVAGKPIAIANVDGTYFAVDDVCTHEECSLANEGFLEGNRITCGCHGSVFDVTSGKVQSLPATSDLATYKIEVQGDDLYIHI